MSLFRRPSEMDSSEGSEEEGDACQPSRTKEARKASRQSRRTATEGVSYATTEDVSSNGRSILVSQSPQGVELADGDDHMRLMLASLMEDHFRTRATEHLNNTNPGRAITRDSPEAQDLGQHFFSQARGSLSSLGLLPSSVMADNLRTKRHQYLSLLDNLVAPPGSVDMPRALPELLPNFPRLSLVPHPASDLQLTIPRPVASFYRSHFREGRLLGKGGFGRVYQCFNPLDNQTYAVKKIPLSPKLSKRFSEGRHGELEEVLREVKALAILDHPNIVRYHATWIEEPQAWPAQRETENFGAPARLVFNASNQEGLSNRYLLPELSRRSGVVLEDDTNSEPSGSQGIVFEEDTPSHPVVEYGDLIAGSKSSKLHDPEPSEGRNIIFGEDTPSHPASEGKELVAGKLEWSHQTQSNDVSEGQSDMFTDGNGVAHLSDKSKVGGPRAGDMEAHVLHIQMTLYPMTLAQYISPPKVAGPGRVLAHCFHLMPTLQILSSILAGLQYIHSKGMVHRDIKPGNIFLSMPTVVPGTRCCEAGHWLNPRIGDFGLVTKLARDGLHPEHWESVRDIVPASPWARDPTGSSDLDTRVGTGYYRPPAWKGSRANFGEKTDIFALGVVFTEMLCPFHTTMERIDTLKALQGGVVPSGVRDCVLRDGHDLVVDKVVQLAQCMVHPDPGERWTGSRVQTAIHEILAKTAQQAAQS